eukprot:Hpha_TRINITY_DN32809_c0_g1::TRINITY_DN32809_c0_g1_i1::g.87288::m.87288
MAYDLRSPGYYAASPPRDPPGYYLPSFAEQQAEVCWASPPGGDVDGVPDLLIRIAVPEGGGGGLLVCVVEGAQVLVLPVQEGGRGEPLASILLPLPVRTESVRADLVRGSAVLTVRARPLLDHNPAPESALGLVVGAGAGRECPCSALRYMLQWADQTRNTPRSRGAFARLPSLRTDASGYPIPPSESSSPAARPASSAVPLLLRNESTPSSSPMRVPTGYDLGEVSCIGGDRPVSVTWDTPPVAGEPLPDIRVEVGLPEVECLPRADVDVCVTDELISISAASRILAQVPFPLTVQPDTARAHFSKRRRVLILKVTPFLCMPRVECTGLKVLLGIAAVKQTPCMALRTVASCFENTREKSPIKHSLRTTASHVPLASSPSTTSSAAPTSTKSPQTSSSSGPPPSLR